MPRIKNIKGLILYKSDKRNRYEHIDSLLNKSINWKFIEKHLDDMLHLAYSISAGNLTASKILKRMCSKKKEQAV